MNNDDRASTRTSAHDQRELIAAYALGLLEAGEREALEQHLEDCAQCRAELSRYDAVMGDMGFSVDEVAPSPRVRTALLEAIRPGPAPAHWLARRRMTMVGLGVAAAIALVSVVVLGVLMVQMRDQRDEARYAEREIAEYLSEGGTLSPMVPSPDAPDDVSPGHGSLAVAPDQSQAMLVMHDLDPSGNGLRYMAWAERDGERVRLGELPVNGEGVGWLVLVGPEPISSYESIGITRFSDDAPDGEPFLTATIRQ